MVKLSTDRKIGIFGYSGYGKSFLGAYLIGVFSTKVPVYLFNTDTEERLNSIPSKNVTAYNAKTSDIKELTKFITTIRAKKTNCMVYVTDMDIYFDGKSDYNKEVSKIKEFISRGRHQRIGLMYESKQMQFIPSKILSNTNLFLIGNFTESNDLKKLKNYATISEIGSLTDHKFILFDRWSLTREIVHFDMNSKALVVDKVLKPLYMKRGKNEE